MRLKSNVVVKKDDYTLFDPGRMFKVFQKIDVGAHEWNRLARVQTQLNQH